MDGSLFRGLQAQLKFGTLRHKSGLSPYLSDQTVIKTSCSLSFFMKEESLSVCESTVPFVSKILKY